MRGIKTDLDPLPFSLDEPVNDDIWKMTEEQLRLLSSSKEKIMIVPSTPSRGFNHFYDAWVKAIEDAKNEK